MAIQQGTTTRDWTSSSYSAGNGACVEVRPEPGDQLAVRDSKAPGGPRLCFGSRSWTAFVGFAGSRAVRSDR